MILSSSLKTKLIVFAASVSFLALTLFLGYNLWSNFEDARNQRVLNLRSLADLMAYNLEAPLAFTDEEAAKTTLNSLRYEKEIAYAILKSAKDDMKVIYNKDDSTDAVDLTRFNSFDGKKEEVTMSHIAIARSVVFQEKTIGEIFIYSPLTSLYQHLVTIGLRAIMVLFVCLAIAVIVANILQKKITQPLSDLLSTMRDIEREQDYGKRIKVTGTDEFSRLMQRFNEMLTEIEKRDTDLEKTVFQRTQELRETISVAEAASQAKSQFLANMSHELRTPLNGIIGMISLLDEHEMPEEQKELIALLSRSADTLLSVISDVLDFSKIEQGKVEIENRPFRIAEVLESVRSIMAFQADEKAIAYIEHVNIPVDYDFMGDTLRLHQVLLNLLSNALKFTSAGGAMILNVWFEEMSDTMGRLNFAVSDTGMGIPKSKSANIFKAFTQADGSTTRQYGGTGLGLAISRQLVQLMSGQIQVESLENVGSCFSFYVTVSFSGKEKEEFVPVVDATEEEVMESHSGLRILVAEDNRINQLLARKLLESEEHTVVIANNGKEATKLVEEEDFDIVLMDVQMPVMDGLEATKLIREMSGAKGQIPIVGVSAHAFQEIKERSVSTGMTGYVTKPYKKKDLLEGIEAAIKDPTDL